MALQLEGKRDARHNLGIVASGRCVGNVIMTSRINLSARNSPA
jgi:hypothetical protein